MSASKDIWLDLGELQKLIDARSKHIIVGPGLWVPSDGTESKAHFFILVIGPEHLRADEDPSITRVQVDDRFKDVFRAGVIKAFCSATTPLVIHDCDDELYMARLAYSIWPTAKMKSILEESVSIFAEAKAQ